MSENTMKTSEVKPFSIMRCVNFLPGCHPLWALATFSFLMFLAPNLANAQKREEPRSFREGFDAYKKGYYESALISFQKAIEDKYTPAYFYIGKMYYEGRFVKNDINDAKAIHNFERAKKTRHDSIKEKSCFYLGRMYELGRGTPPDTTKAIANYEKSSLTEAKVRLGNIYWNQGKYKKAKATYLRAIKKDTSDKQQMYMAEYKLGYMYISLTSAHISDEKELKKERDKGPNWLQQAENHGNKDAMFLLGEISEGLINNVWEEKSYEEALIHYRKGVAKEDPRAEYKYGYFYENGLGGLTKSLWQAAHYYQKAIDHGYPKELQKHVDSLNRIVELERNGSEQKRTALIIGNSRYQNIEPVKNAQRDANSLGIQLNKLGFVVKKVQDGTKREMEGAIQDFCNAVSDYDVALFFYAGHGMQSDGRNFMIPVDYDHNSSTSMSQQAVDLSQNVFQCLSDKSIETNIVIIDACRVAKFGEGRLLGSGTIPPGFFVSYSAMPGQKALDGVRNSPYMTALLDNLKKPGLNITTLFDKVKLDVTRATEEKQIPVSYNSLYDDSFIFNRNITPKQ